MPQSKLLYPYEYTSQIRLVARDPHDPTDEDRVFRWSTVEEESNEEVGTLDLTHEDRPWERLRFQVEASLPDDDVARLLPMGAAPSQELKMYVGVTCTTTRLREAVELGRDGDVWRGHVALRRSQVRGTVELTPFLVRATDLLTEPAFPQGQPLATEHAMRVGEGRRLALVVDPPNRALKGFVKTVWENFAESTDPVRRGNDSLVHDLDLGGDEPVLVLNSGHTGMRAALHSRKRTGGAAVMRHTLNAGIAHDVWLQLFLVALGAIDYSEESGEVTLPGQPWKRRVLEALIENVPSTLPKDQRLKNLVQLRDGQMEILVPSLSLAAQRIIRMNRLLREAERSAERFIDAPESSP